MTTATAPPPALVAGRTCGTCTLCCKVVGVSELAKPAGSWCSHCRPSRGCTIYDMRPAGCRDFYCEWLRSEKLGPEWKPERAKFAIIVSERGHLTVCVDPGFPMAWRQPPYYESLRRWARQQAEDPSSTWPAVDVAIGKRVIILLPDGEADLGTLAADEEVRISRLMTPSGPAFVAAKFKVPGRNAPPADAPGVATG
jgi:hypothetical protein